MRPLSTLALAAMISTTASVSNIPLAIAGGVTDCSRTEQAGCLEIDILNYRYHPADVELALAKQGQSMYYRYKGSDAQTAGRKCYFVYFWNPRSDVDVSKMSEYHIIGRDGKHPYRTEVSEVSPTSGPSFNTQYDIGDPDRAFEVCGDAAVMAFQFPYQMIGNNTYILVCSEQETAVPGPNEGEWLTPRVLTSIVRDKHEYWFAPFVHARGRG